MLRKKWRVGRFQFPPVPFPRRASNILVAEKVLSLAMPKLYIIDQTTGDSTEYSLEKTLTSIGKKPGNDILLDRHNISRDHCQILQINGGYLVRDLDSRNGTYVNGQRVSSDTPLASGMMIQLGDFVLRFLDESAGPAAAEAKPRPTPRPATPPPPPSSAGERKGPVGPADEMAERRKLAIAVKKKIHEQLIKELNLKQMDLTKETPEELRIKTTPVVEKIVGQIRQRLPAGMDPAALIKEVVDEAVALGPLEDLLADPEVDEIMVNNWDTIYVERHGKIVRVEDKYFTDNRQLISIIRRILAPISRRIDESSPMVDARLPIGSRVNAIIPPLAISGPTLTIRKFATDPFTVDDLIRFGSLTKRMAAFLTLCVEQRKNVLVSGGTGSGKTTLLNVLSNFIPERERIVTIEDAAELKLMKPHVVSLESKPPNIEGKGAIPIRDLVKNSLRMRPDRIVVGECRGGEALDMLQAMNTGHDGSLTTLHANSTKDAINRLETLVLMSGMELPSRAIREQIASAVNVIVQQARLSDGSRKVTCISEILGIEGDEVLLQDVYRFEQTGYNPQGRVQGRYVATGAVPKFVQDLVARGIRVDMGMFDRGEAS
ncbi:MAG: Flp pilus assembly complex ATPase component TadA [Planctomycetes bacterium]|nr:Flp pilus assembly complex ATPase component TadA [Planctomycetota bacterium]